MVHDSRIRHTQRRYPQDVLYCICEIMAMILYTNIAVYLIMLQFDTLGLE